MRSFSPFDVVFLAGLVVSVRVMVAGVEREQALGRMVVRSRWAVLAGMLTLSGFLGALCVRIPVARTLTAIAVLLGLALGALSARFLVSRAAAMPVTDHEFDPRFSLQGMPATVIAAIAEEHDGLVQLPAGASQVSPIRARSLDGKAIAAGVEVGVERIDDGVAYVEEWSAIEARL